MLTRILAVLALLATPTAQNQGGAKTPDVLNFTMDSLDGKPISLAKYQGKVLLIVNVASECGYTYQYEGLQKLYAQYADRGLRILGFPSNDFGEQEPGTNSEIAQFCQKNYGVTFDMFSKIRVLGSSKAPLYAYLTDTNPNGRLRGNISWNFEKFLVNRDGQVIGRFKSPVEPLSKELVSAIEVALGK
jgi:glutathione peroxidase